MGSIDSAFGGNCDGNFQTDDFYESFLAPKFHDFTAPEEPIDPDAYFLANPGIQLKKAVLVEEVNLLTRKEHTVAAQGTSKAAPVIQQQAPIKSPLPAEKAVGSAKKGLIGTVSDSMSPLTSKSLNVKNNAYDSTPQFQGKDGNASLRSIRLVKTSRASENEDPNPSANPIQIADASTSIVEKSTRQGPEERPALARQCSQKFLEPRRTAGASDVHHIPKFSGDPCMTKNNYDDSSADKKVLMKPNALKPFGTNIASGVAVNVLKLNAVIVACSPTGEDDGSTASAYKIIVTEPISGHQVMACTEKTGLPNTGHHSKSSICAAIDPSSLSAAPARKYLNASNGIPGSAINAAPSLAGVGTCNEEITLGKSRLQCDKAQKGDEGCNHADLHDAHQAVTDTSVVGENKHYSNVNDHFQASLDDSFLRMTLDRAQTTLLEEQIIHESLNACAIPEVTQPEDEDFKIVSLAGESRIVEPKQSLSSGVAVERVGGSSTSDKAAGISGMGLANSSINGLDEQPNAAGMDCEVACENMDYLETRNLSDLELAQSKHGRKGNSRELLLEAASKRANFAKSDTCKSMSKKPSLQICHAKTSAVSKSPHLPRPRMKRLSLAWRVTNPRVTNPQPFRLRTQERGAAKEQEFSKKVEKHRAAKEGFHSAFQGLAVAEPKIPGRLLKPGSSHGFSAKRGDKEVEGTVAKAVIPPAQKAPLFDRPFKPHRSTRKLTVPQEPKFHIARSACPSNVVVP
uniref:Uncharacterized protein n=1 Tax=Physcomitrium patens TaxID=3218 RepID=A0A7I4DW30_PHYPA